MNRWTPWLYASMIALAAGMPTSAVSQQNPHGPLPTGMDCVACHTPEGWAPLRTRLDFRHGENEGFVLTGAHDEVDCATCHLELRFDAPDLPADDCAGCHVDVHEGQILDDCASCHGTESFFEVDGELIHSRSALPLDGAHLEVPCQGCHADEGPGLYTGLEPDCAACHMDAYASTETIDHEEAGYPTECMSCHTALGWSDAPFFDHIASSAGFPLLGAHQEVQCASCHVVPGMASLFATDDANDCVTCHQEDFDREHPGSSFDTDCTTCHTLDGWEVTDFEHRLTGFELLGAHAPLDCADCHSDGHRGLLFATPASQDDCVVCHQTDYDEEHTGTGFPLDCASCHTVDDWDDADFDHADTAFPLVGSHDQAECTSCHGNGGVLLLPAPASPEDCASCHQVDYDEEHTGSGFPTTCLDCHEQTDWDRVSINHPALSDGFELLGRHDEAECVTCHTLPDFGLLFAPPASQNDCVVCHQTEYDGEHNGTGFPLDCAACHTETTWDGATFDHGDTGLPLVGAHDAADCTSCHGDGGVLVVPTPAAADDCASCHQTDYDDQHTGSGFPDTCLDCHDQSDWQNATIDHPALANGFQLLGRHAQAECITCHTLPDFGLLFAPPASENDCVVCHQTDYDAQHAGTGFSLDCAACHTEATWLGATFDHDGTGFPLIGAHVTNACATCHGNGGTLVVPQPAAPDDCVACHQVDYDTKHGGSTLPTTCLDCHSQTTWTGATFNHIDQGFDLVGRHATAECISCHTVPDYGLHTGTPGFQDDCLACHQVDFDQSHAGTGYPGACLACHDQTDWQNSSYDHDAQYFPIHSGKHQGEWNNQCVTCHTVPTDFTNFTCTDCHEHRKSEADAEHKDEAGYVYDSAACYSCHTNGTS